MKTPEIGEKFGMITFLGEGPRKISGKKATKLRSANVKCDCGREYNILLASLKYTSNCGCTRRVYDKLDAKQVMALYDEIKNADIVAERLNLNNGNAVRRVLKENGYELTTRKYNIDQNYFEVIDSEEKAYWLGFIAADGTIRLRHGNVESKNRGSSIILKLAVKDTDQVKRFSDVFGGGSKLEYNRDYTKTKDGRPSYSDYCRVGIYSNKLVEDIIDKGVTPRKSFTISKPNIDEKYMFHYLRGYFDGNGSISFEAQESKKYEGKQIIKKLNVSIATGSVMLKEWIIDFCAKHDVEFVKSNKFDIISKNMKTARNFIRLIYKDATIYLERKHKIAMEFLDFYETNKEMGTKRYI